MARFQPASLDKIGRYHRFVIDRQKEIDQIEQNPQPDFGWFDILTIKFLKLRLRDNMRVLEAMHSHWHEYRGFHLWQGTPALYAR